MATLPLPDPNNPLVKLPATQGIATTYNLLPAGTQGPRIQAIPVQQIAPPELTKTPDLGGTQAKSPDLPAVKQPNLLNPNSPQARLQNDQTTLTRLQQGPAVDQIQNGFGRTLAKIGDGLLTAVAPGIARLTPGTTQNNLLQQARITNRIGEEQGEQQKEAQQNLLNAQAQYKPLQMQQAAALTQAKIADLGAKDEHYGAQNDHYQDQASHWDDQSAATLAAHGYKRDDKGALVPMKYEEMSPTMQAIEDYKHAQSEQAEAQAQLAKAKNDPSSPAYRLAADRNAIAMKNAQTALGRLSMQGQGLAMRREMMDANLYGTDANGSPLPGAPQLEDENGNLHTVGLRAGNMAIKQQGKVTSFNDLQGSAQHARQALDALHASGSSLSDPAVVAAMSDPTSITGKVVNGKLVKANLSDSQVKAIGALNQLREQIGIMRATTGGPAAEAQAQRMLSALPEAGDAQNTAKNKMDELGGVLDRLRPGAVHVVGGLRVQGQPQAGSPAQQSAGGSIPAAAAAQLKEGVVHTFGNGQQWTMRNGQPVRVK